MQPEQQKSKFPRHDRSLYTEEAMRQASRKARLAVKYANKRFRMWVYGDIPSYPFTGCVLFKPCYCPLCGSALTARRTHAHHYTTPEHENWLKVVQMCATCHQKVHVLEREYDKRNFPRLAGLRAYIRQQMERAEQECAKAGHNAPAPQTTGVSDA